MDIERSLEPITDNDLKNLYRGSVKRLDEYFIRGEGMKHGGRYDIKSPLAVALCQGAAMHYYDGENGVKDFDIWFFYPFNQQNLPYRTCWKWDYQEPKFGRHPATGKHAKDYARYTGRKVEVWVRSIKNYHDNDPVKTIYKYFQCEGTCTSKLLAEKAVVMLSHGLLGKVIWYKGRRI